MTNHLDPTVVALPAEIDMYNRNQACDRLGAACDSGASVIIADFTGTRFCDPEAMRRLLAVAERAAASAAQLRFAIPPGHPVRRLADRLDPGHRVPVYASPGEAAAVVPVPRSRLPHRP